MLKNRNNDFPSHDSAAQLALGALRFLAADMELWAGFEAQSGVSPDMLGALVAEPGFLAGVLDYLLQDESLLLSFSSNSSTDPALIIRAKHVLAGDI